MKASRIFLILSIIMFAIALGGCSKDEENPIAPGDNGNTGGGNPVPTDFGGASPNNVLVVIRSVVSQSGFTFSTGMGVGNLNNQDKGEVNVNVNGTDYIFTKETSNGNVNYLLMPSQTNPTGIQLNSGATNVTFSVSGYALNNSTVSVPGEITMTAPAANSNVTRSSGLSISWSGATGGNYKAISIVDGAGKSIYKEILGSSNSAAFTADELNTLSAGNGLVYAISYNYTLANNDDAVLIGEAVSVNNIILQ